MRAALLFYKNCLSDLFCAIGQVIKALYFHGYHRKNYNITKIE